MAVPGTISILYQAERVLHLALIIILDVSHETVSTQDNATRPSANADSDALSRGIDGISHPVALELKVVGCAVYTDPPSRAHLAVINDAIVDKAIAVAGHRLTFVTEVDSPEPIVGDYVPSEEVIGIFVSDRDADRSVLFQHIVLKDAVAHAPAEKQTDLAVVAADAAPDDGTLAATAWV